MGVHENLTGAQRTARYRAAKRAAGLRPIQIWLPDLRRSDVRARFKADAEVLAAQFPKWADVLGDAEAMSAEVLDDLLGTGAAAFPGPDHR